MTITEQYKAAKVRYPRHLLLFRIGDFYELFNDDAKMVQRALGLTLTRVTGLLWPAFHITLPNSTLLDSGNKDSLSQCVTKQEIRYD